MLSFWIRHRYRFFSGGEGEPFRKVSCQAIHHHLPWSFRHILYCRMDSCHWDLVLDFQPHPVAHADGESPSRREIHVTDRWEVGRGKDRAIK